ncbi:hypothetical protein DCAR_0100866 [Daucus carota subsp. sativus]|uniref:Uncharacterized protein n=1 Tax=Daucus carota subsp. sativus TaxID=79200 RepID=A0A166FZD5_DAUCS|nr:hypothetical protein DCAR_0100866 [Daucus carota subsp. sativus]
MGIVRLLPSVRPCQFLEKLSKTDKQLSNEAAYELEEASEARDRQKQQPVSEIVELDKPVNTDEPQNKEDGGTVKSEMEFRGLDHADSLGLILISCRANYLVNWLVNALTSLNHPNSENALPLVTIYGPKVYDLIEGQHCGFLKNIYFSDMQDNERNLLESKNPEQAGPLRNKKDKCILGISVITVSLGFLTNFEDVCRLWEFASKFLDADFVEKEKWRYLALNQTTVEGDQVKKLSSASQGASPCIAQYLKLEV